MSDALKRAILARIDEGLKRTGLNDQAAAVRAGLGKDIIRDLRRKPKAIPSIPTIEALAHVLGMRPETLAFGVRSKSKPGPTEPMPIKGEVAAGLWLEIAAQDDAEMEEIPVPFHPGYRAEAQYGLIVRGSSMNKIAQPGDVLQCLDCGISNVTPDDGDIVIVERRRAQAGQKEVTAKRFRRHGKNIELSPESTDNRWKSPIILDPRRAPDGEEIAVIAIVIGVYKPIKR